MLTSCGMRFGVLGPANGDLAALEEGRASSFSSTTPKRSSTLGPMTRSTGWCSIGPGVWWATILRERHLGARGVSAAARPGTKTSTVSSAAERKRERLEALKCLPAATARTVEIFEGRVAVFLYDKALLDEEDILPASLLVFGKSQEPLVRQVGSRTFISPGEMVKAKVGVILLADDPNGDLNVSLFEPRRNWLESHHVSASRTGQVPRARQGELGRQGVNVFSSGGASILRTWLTSSRCRTCFRHPRRRSHPGDSVFLASVRQGAGSFRGPHGDVRDRHGLAPQDDHLARRGRARRRESDAAHGRAPARAHPDWRMRLVVGADILLEGRRWHGFDRVVELAPLLVLGRRGSPLQEPRSRSCPKCRAPPFATRFAAVTRVRSKLWCRAKCSRTSTSIGSYREGS